MVIWLEWSLLGVLRSTASLIYWIRGVMNINRMEMGTHNIPGHYTEYKVYAQQ